jgi:hypothetical protein
MLGICAPIPPRAFLDYFRRSFPSRVVETCCASCASLAGAVPPALPVLEHDWCFTIPAPSALLFAGFCRTVIFL